MNDNVVIFFIFSKVFHHGFLKCAKNQEMVPVTEKPMNIPKLQKDALNCQRMNVCLFLIKNYLMFPRLNQSCQ